MVKSQQTQKHLTTNNCGRLTQEDETKTSDRQNKRQTNKINPKQQQHAYHHNTWR